MRLLPRLAGASVEEILMRAFGAWTTIDVVDIFQYFTAYNCYLCSILVRSITNNPPVCAGSHQMLTRASLAVGPFFLGKPTNADRQAVERRVPKLPSNFPFVGITRGDSTGLESRPELRGWTVDRKRTKVGEGQEAYKRAMQAVLSWENFDFDWFFTNAPPVRPDAPVVVTAQILFLWSVLPLRVTWIEKDGAPRDRRQRERVKRRMAFGVSENDRRRRARAALDPSLCPG